MVRSTFYTVCFDSRDSFNAGVTQCSRTFSTVRMARKAAESYRAYADNVRVMQGGPGGVEVK